MNGLEIPVLYQGVALYESGNETGSPWIDSSLTRPGIPSLRTMPKTEDIARGRSQSESTPIPSRRMEFQQSG